MEYVSTRVVEQIWKDKFMWLWEHGKEGNEAADFVFPILIHPDTSDRFVKWLQGFGDSVQFYTHEQIATAWLSVKQKEVLGI
ncbi:polysaccharide deacetylase family protein [Penicillium malachiteum]|uniref:polysaccharide deacetylase family protein n=1 Tax=Penicillium malachiteum TaxID=1324776 RepID=UPI0025484CA6|nr:polysaccharide deacetylase family protein [Penicillium malachiteum]KAJ5736962.1 polysaccharide deacetylase family protein [Penicillium malachiteum]